VAGDRGRVFVADGDRRRILALDVATNRLHVHAVGFGEPTGLASSDGALLVADFADGRVAHVDRSGDVETLARLERVTAVAAAADDVYAVTMDGALARLSAGGAIELVRVPGGLTRPHGVAIAPDGTVLVAEDSTRVRRVDPRTGRVETVVDGVDTNKIAVRADGTLFLAGAGLRGGTLRRRDPDGRLRMLLDDLRVSDVALLPDGFVVATTVGPGAVYRIDPLTGERAEIAG
jgi:sugar lactone lactonase YvrE